MNLVLGLLAVGWASEITRDHPGDVMPDRHWDFVHLNLEVDVDVAGGSVEGRATHTVRRLPNDSTLLRLHQVALDISSVTVDGAEVTKWVPGREWIDIPMPASGEEHEVAVSYSATPQLGLHFRGGRGSSDPVLEAWTQGENEDNRYWFPGWDYPNDKFSLDLHIDASSELMAFGNGVLVSKEDRGEKTRWHYRLERPIVNYLVALAVGDYRMVEEPGPVPLQYISASVHDEATIRRGFDQAKPQMVFFNELLGTPYPYPVYRQVMVSRFIYGGMENASMTINTASRLVTDPNGRTRGAEELSAHELAHQWFGDLLTCYGWRELWLNEGFATFYTGRWVEHRYGRTDYDKKLRQWLQWASNLETPMSPRGWSAVSGRDNEGVYVRGASVLHMLRVYLGDEVFDEAIAAYVANHTDRLVETDDLRRTFEEVSGTHLGWFFDQWVHGTGIPSIESGWAWADGVLTVTLNQTTEGTPFSMPVEIEVAGVGTRSVWLAGGEARLVLDLDEAPAWVAVDPRGGVLASWEHDQTAEAWAAQALEAPTPFARLEAIAQLGETEGAEIAIETLTALLADQQEPASLREVVAESLGALGTEAAIEALVATLDDPSADLREAAAWSLSEVEETPLAVKALTRAANEDLDTTVQWISMYALSSMAPEKSVALARRVLGRPDRSWQMRLHQQAVSILGQDGARNDLPILLDRGRAKWPREVRRAASQAALKLLDREDEEWSDKHEDRLARVLLDALQDPDLRVRQFALSMLGRLGSEEALGGLKRFGAENEVIRPDLSELARDAATLIRRAQWSDDEPDDEEADEDLEALTQRLEELEERLEHLEEWR